VCGACGTHAPHYPHPLCEFGGKSLRGLEERGGGEGVERGTKSANILALEMQLQGHKKGVAQGKRTG
jgi:hypothetical protein